MGRMIGTEVSMSALVEDFLQTQVEAAAACRAASGWIAAPTARAVVARLAELHAHDLGQLRELARTYGAHPPLDAGEHEAQRFGRLARARDRHDDAAILDTVGGLEDEVIAAYERVLAGTTLTDTLTPTFEQALGALCGERARLAAARRQLG